MHKFSVIGSKTLRLNSKYRVLVTSHSKDSEGAELYVAITCGDHHNPEICAEETLKVNNYESKLIDFQIDNRNEEFYYLEAKGSCGWRQLHRLDLNLKNFSVFVQTDKAVYKPGDKVRFRVLLLDANTRPFESSNVLIYVTDSLQNRIKQISNAKFLKGVFQDEFQLSDSPTLGQWKINVKVDDAKEESKSFEVDEYVLPKFEVVIETDPHVLFKDRKIEGRVYGKYTYGKLVKGKAKVTAKQNAQIFGPYRSTSIIKCSQKLKVDGKGDFEFEFKDDFEIKEIDKDFEVYIDATFTEELTGKVHEASTTVKVHKFPGNIELIKDVYFLKPGLTSRTEAIVKNHRGDPITSDEVNKVEFKITFFDKVLEARETSIHNLYGQQSGPAFPMERWVEKVFETVTKEASVENGKSILEMKIPQNAVGMSIEAKYLENPSNKILYAKMNNENTSFIQMKIPKNCTPTVGCELPISVKSTDKLTTLSYIIIGRDNIIESKTFEVPNSKNFEFQIVPTLEMKPKVFMVVFYTKSDGEIISDQIEIKIGFKLKNSVKIDLSSEHSKPGESVELEIKADPNSLVGLLGVDQSVLLQKSGNDLDWATILKDSEGYQGFNEPIHLLAIAMSHSKRFSDFILSHATVMTNIQEVPTYHFGSNAGPSFGQIRSAGLFGSPAPQQNSMMMSQTQQSFGASRVSPSYSIDSNFFLRPPTEVGPPPPKIRKTFPETWIFDSFEMKNGKHLLTKKVPDTITSWVVTGFAVDPEKGLGLTEAPVKLNVFQPFFVSTNLPYSIKQGETVLIPINVFNYLETTLEVEVTLFNSDNEFEFQENGKFTEESKLSKRISNESNCASTAEFKIKPKIAGNIKIKVTATSDAAGDGLEQLLIVEPEGVTQFKNEAFLIDLRNSKTLETKFSIEIPENAVQNSTRIDISAIGDILGPSIENLDKLIRIPYGCGEQNMLNFVPNIIVLEYLTALQRLTPEIETKAKRFMETGYQQELTYKHRDGSFSAFGGSDKSGSTWLTAFVAKSFHQASKYIEIDEKIVNDTLDFLAKTQMEDGSFKEVGTIFHKDMQGGSSKGLALTAYVLITFLENTSEIENFKKIVDNALNFIICNISSLDDTYSLAIVAYALQIANHPMKDSVMEKLNAKAEVQDELKFWKKSNSELESKKSWNYQPNAINIEMTAYALLAHVETDLITESVPIMNWLIRQRNENGGYQSTQDTILGLQALSKLSAKIYFKDTLIDISVKNDENAETKFSVNPENAIVLQKHRLQSSARNFEVSATGQGFCMLQLSYKFNMSEKSEEPSFILETKLNDFGKKNSLNLSVETSYVPKETSEKSNMAVMEVSFPSGFVFDADHLETLKSFDKVQKVETKLGETVVIVYFYDIDVNKIVLEIKAVRSYDVAQLKPASILIYDYYDNSRRAMTFYEVDKA